MWHDSVVILALASAIFILALVSVWWDICVDKAYKQRLAMIDACYLYDQAHQLRTFTILKVTKMPLRGHARHMFFLRDPIKLYPADVVDAWKTYRKDKA